MNNAYILLPNINEFQRLQSTKDQTVQELSEELGVIIIEKGKLDKIAGPMGKIEICNEEGSPRRYGGQGDCLSGTVGVFMGWANEFVKNNKDVDDIAIKLSARHASKFIDQEMYE
jgi:ATP-dependent NAD(P)H-hydrate dehydratase